MFELLLKRTMGTDNSEALFFRGELFFIAIAILVVLLFRSRSPKSKFKVREADRVAEQTSSRLKPQIHSENSTAQSLANAKMKSHRPLAIEGMSIVGKEPHEILNVRGNANATEIHKAYRDLMKRYHPDRIGRPGSREWEDAQKIAEAINHARDVMIQTLKSKTTKA